MVCRLTVYGLLVWCIAAMVNAQSTVLNCPPGTTQYNNYCFPNNICPVNTVFKNGFCEVINEGQNLQCPAPFVLRDGICLNEPLIQPCSSNSQNCIVDKNLRMECASSMINFNGGCAPQTVATCPYSTTLQNGICTRENTCTSNTCNSGNIVCPIDSTMVGNTCVRNTPCSSQTTNLNGACAVCPYDKYREKTVCPPPVVTIVTVTQTPVVAPPPVVITPEPKIIRIVEPPVIVYLPAPVGPAPTVKETKISVQQAPPSNQVNKIDITNIVNNHNIHNVPTNINAVNINNINLDSRTGSLNIDNHDRSDTHEEGSDGTSGDELVIYDEVCCVIMEPRTCVPVGDKIKCHHTRHHKCGAECIESGSDPNVSKSYQTYSEKTDTPVDETTPDSLEGEIAVTPGTYPETYPGTNPGHYPYPQSYPVQYNLYQSQTNQYPLPYPGQYNPYLNHNQGQPSPIPYPFPGGYNVGSPTSYPGQQYPMPFPYPGGQNTGVAIPNLGQPYAIPHPSNMEVLTSYPGQSNPVPYHNQGQSLGVYVPYPGQTGQSAYPSQYSGGLSSAFSPSNCVQQQTWPFVNCAQNVKIGKNKFSVMHQRNIFPTRISFKIPFTMITPAFLCYICLI